MAGKWLLAERLPNSRGKSRIPRGAGRKLTRRVGEEKSEREEAIVSEDRTGRLNRWELRGAACLREGSDGGCCTKDHID